MSILPLLMALACAPGGEAISAEEAYDVPPPPGARTLAFELSWAPELGQVLTVEGERTVTVDVVDVSDTAPFVVTGYVAATDAERLLAGGRWSVRRPR